MSEIPEHKEWYASGHRGCAGCGEMNAVRQVLLAAGGNSVVACCTGCLEVSSTGFPETAWEVPFIHAAFENSAAVASGVEVALKAKGRKEGVNVFAFGGDGGTFDIGFQALSGMLERGHDVTYVCFDNEAYMNTGIQRCSSTPYGASTTTSPAGKISIGEQRKKKPLALICAAHGVPYVATACISFQKDLEKKVKKCISMPGPKFLHIFAPCPTGWRHGSDTTIEIGKLAVQTGMFILWECENGDLQNIKVTKKIKDRKPVEEYMKMQGRYRHVMKQPDVIAEIQKQVDEECAKFGVDLVIPPKE